MAGYPDEAGTVGTLPTPTRLTDTEAYHAEGVVWSHDMANQVMVEILNAIVILGLTLDKDDFGQLAEAVAHLRGLRSSGTDSPGLTCLDLRAALASLACEVGGAQSAAVAANSCDITGGGSGTSRLAAAAINCVIDSGTFTAALLAANRAKLSGVSQQVAVIASEGDTTDGVNCAAAGNQAAILASFGSAADPTRIDIAAAEALIAACRGSEVGSGGVASALLASLNSDVTNGLECLIAASVLSAINNASATGCAIIGSQGLIGGAGAHNGIYSSDDVAIASASGANAIIASANAGGASPLINNPAGASLIGSSTGDVDITGAGCTALSCDTGAGTGPLLSGTRCSAISSTGQFDAQGSGTVVLASNWGGGPGIVLGAGDSNKVVLGDTAGGGVGASLRTNVTDAVTGGVLADAAYVATGADYAECFPNRNPGIIPVGSLVSHVKGEAQAAQAGERVLGVVSANPTVVGNASPLSWQGAVKRDEMGSIEWTTVDWVSWPERRRRVHVPQLACVRWGACECDDGAEVDGYDGPISSAPETVPPGATFYRRDLDPVVLDPGREGYDGPLADCPLPADELPDDATAWVRRMRTGNKNYDPGLEYASRPDRPEEWTVVALLGQVPVRVDGTVRPGSYVVPGKDGVGTHADEPPRTGRPIECLRVAKKSTKKRGCAIALCLVG